MRSKLERHASAAGPRVSGVGVSPSNDSPAKGRGHSAPSSYASLRSPARLVKTGATARRSPRVAGNGHAPEESPVARFVNGAVHAEAANGAAPHPAGPIRTLVVDDYRLYGEALATQLATHAGLLVLGSLGLEEGLRELPALAPQVVVISAVQSQVGAIQLIGKMREAVPGARVLVLVAETSSWAAVQAINAGASGFVLQGETVDGLARAIRTVNSGQIVCPSAVTALLFSHVAGGVPVVHASSAASRLTGRQMEIVALVGQGMSNKEIARRLSVSLHTVKNHIHNLLERLGLRSRVEVALFARRTGLLAHDHDTPS